MDGLKLRLTGDTIELRRTRERYSRGHRDPHIEARRRGARLIHHADCRSEWLIGHRAVRCRHTDTQIEGWIDTNRCGASIVRGIEIAARTCGGTDRVASALRADESQLHSA